MNEAQELALRARLMFEFLRNFKQEASRDLKDSVEKAMLSNGEVVSYELSLLHLEKIEREYQGATTPEEKNDVFLKNTDILSSVFYQANRFAEVAGEMGADQFRQYAPDEMLEPANYETILSGNDQFARLAYEMEGSG